MLDKGPNYIPQISWLCVIPYQAPHIFVSANVILGLKYFSTSFPKSEDWHITM